MEEAQRIKKEEDRIREDALLAAQRYNENSILQDSILTRTLSVLGNLDQVMSGQKDLQDYSNSILTNANVSLTNQEKLFERTTATQDLVNQNIEQSTEVIKDIKRQLNPIGDLEMHLSFEFSIDQLEEELQLQIAQISNALDTIDEIDGKTRLSAEGNCLEFYSTYSNQEFEEVKFLALVDLRFYDTLVTKSETPFVWAGENSDLSLGYTLQSQNITYWNVNLCDQVVKLNFGTDIPSSQLINSDGKIKSVLDFDGSYLWLQFYSPSIKNWVSGKVNERIIFTSNNSSRALTYGDLLIEGYHSEFTNEINDGRWFTVTLKK